MTESLNQDFLVEETEQKESIVQKYFILKYFFHRYIHVMKIKVSCSPAYDYDIER